MEKGKVVVRYKKKSLWKIATLLFLVLLVLSVVTQGFTKWSFASASNGKILTGEAAGKKAVDYLNTKVLQGQTASVTSVAEVDGLYNLKLNVGGNAYDSYVTKDGKWLFPQGIELIAVNASNVTPSTPKPTVMPKTDKPNVEAFVMAFCPYGIQAEKGLIPVQSLLKDKANFTVRYVIYSNYGGGGPSYCIDNASQYCSMHGINEMKEDVRQMCIQKNYPKATFWSYLSYVAYNCTVQTIDTCWKDAAKATNVDTAKIQTCFDKEGIDLAKAEKAYGDSLQVSGSPTIFVNGADYTGGRAPEDFKQGICGAFNKVPSECNQTIGNVSAAAPAGSC